MDLRHATASSFLQGRLRPGRFAVSGSLYIGEGHRPRHYQTAGVVAAYQVTATAAGDAVSHTLLTGVVQAITGSPLIQDGDGKDVEWNTFPNLGRLHAIRVTTGRRNIREVVLGGETDGLLPAASLGSDSEITLRLSADGELAIDAVLTLGFLVAGDSILVELLGEPGADDGYIFVILQDGRQLFHADGRAIQVPSSYAN